MFRDRVIAPTIIGLGAGGMVLGAACIAFGGPWLATYGVLELLGGVVAVRGGRALWRYQERQRLNGWPD